MVNVDWSSPGALLESISGARDVPKSCGEL
jgi:hypothetical protein